MGDLLTGAVKFLQAHGYLTKRQAEKVESFDDISITSAIAKFQRFDANVAIKKRELGEDLLPDGQIGPATAYAMAMPRCAAKDNVAVAPAQGQGGWRGCHGVGDFHSAIVTVHRHRMPSFLKPDFVRILTQVRAAYAELGLLWVFRDSSTKENLISGENVDGPTNTDFVFENGNGWIGLAIVGNGSNQQCTSNIWCKYDPRYQPGNIFREWATLILHELGHNCSLQHSSGGVMNPSLINGLPGHWRGDPHEGTLRRLFGGEPVPIPDDPQPPPGDPDERPDVGQPLSESFEWWDGTRAQVYRVLGGS